MDNTTNKYPKKPRKSKEIVAKTPEMYQLYTTHFRQIFENINYYISKKNPYYAEIIEKTESYTKKIAIDYDMNGDKYIPIIIKSLFIENYKLAKYVLPDLIILIKNNFILGRNDIIKYRADLGSFLVKDIRTFFSENIFNKKILDLIIVILTNLDEIYQDKDIWFYLGECLSEIIHNNYMVNNIIGETFKKIYEFYFRIFNKFEDDEKKQKKIKSDLSYFINFVINVFSKFYFSEINEELNTNNTYSNYLKNLYNKLDTFECLDNSKNKIKAYNPIDLLVCRTVKYMVDTICFRFEEQKNNINANNPEYKIIPLIPKKESDFKKMIFRFLPSQKILNELCHHSSYFGWCYICRKSASYYCNEYYLPICSFHCKDTIQKEEDDINKINFLIVKNCAKMFEFFCKILEEKKYLPHQKVLAFSLLEEMINKHGKTFKQSKMFKKIVKTYLIDGLIKTSLSKDEKVFIPAIKMFFKVWKLFKKNIKKEIYYYNENVLIKIINSSNASFLHKKTVLENYLSQEFFYFLELFINYDFDLSEKFLVYNLISTFSDIIKGSFYKNSKNNNNYTDKENIELINYALNIITFILQSILDFSSKIFLPEKNVKNLKNKELEKNSNLFLTFPAENILYNTFSNNFNYSSVTTDINISEGQKNNSDRQISEDTMQELLSTQRMRNTNSNLSKNLNVKKNSDYEIALEKFNIKYEYGLSYLKTLGYINISSIEEEINDINKFFIAAKNIDKNNLFEFLGENTLLSTKALEKFMENFNFINVDIVQAIKILFGNLFIFKSREIFEKFLICFSIKYCKDNFFKYFEKEENIFYLSYAIIILIYTKEKIENTEFILMVNNIFLNNNNKNIFEGEFLNDIYIQVKNEFNLNLNNNLNINFNLNNISKIKYNPNINKIYTEKKYKIISKEEIGEYLYQLTLLIWKKLSVTCNIIIEESNDENIYKKGICGIVYIIQILGLMELEQQKQTVIALICFMSNLLQVKPIKEKNIYCIKQILFLANGDYRFCKGGWDSILKIINKLHFYYLLDTMPKFEKDEFIKNYKNFPNEKDNIEKLPKIFTPNNYEKIFNKSYFFDFETLIEFMQSMCEIARKEFIDNGLTKTFFLQKIVETAENNIFSNKKGINMNQIWKILSHFFVKIGSLNSTENSITCIDSLRQLVSKFLTNKQCNENKFQTELFKPFLQIINISKNNETKEYIYSCVNTLVTSYIKNIKYGWVTVINIYKELYYITEFNNIKIQVLDIFISITEKYFNEISGVMNNLISFLKLYIPSFPIKTMKIIKILFKNINNENNYRSLIKLYLNYLINENEEIRNKSIANLNYNISKDYLVNFNFLKDIYKKENFWKLIFKEVLYKSMDYLSQKISEFSYSNSFNIINSISNNNVNISLSDSFTDVSSYKSLNVKGARNNTNEKIKYANTLYSIAINTSEIFNNFFEFNNKEFPEFLIYLEKIIFFDDEKVQKIGIQVVKYLFGLDKNKNHFFLQPFIKFLISVLNKSSASELSKLNYKEIITNSGSKIFIHNIEKNIFLSHIHYNILYLLDNSFPKILNYLKLEEIMKLIDMFHLSYINSINFNSKIKLRFAIADLIKMNYTINLFQQFKISIKNYFFLSEYICSKNKEEIAKNYRNKIFFSAENILIDFIKKEKEYKTFFEKNNNKNEENIEKEFQEKEIIINYYIGPLCENIFPALKRAKFHEDEKYKDIFCKIFLDLISSDQIKIRENIKDLLNIIFDCLYE